MDSWLDIGVDFSPVDEVAKAIGHICTYGDNSGVIYHASPNQKITYREMLIFWRKAGIEIKPAEIFYGDHESGKGLFNC